MDYRSIIESKYNREKWQILLYDIFKKGANFLATPIPVDAKSDLAICSAQLGTITLTDGNKIAVYEIKLSETVDILVNRVGIRNLLASDWKMKGCVGAFMFCFRDNESVLRFSYVSQTMGFDEDGKLIKKETDTKRFTYYLGEGHRSRTAIKQFEELKNSKLGLADITKAFSIEALSDKFFKDYKDIYEDIVEYATGKRMIKVSNKWEERVIKAPNSSIMNGFRCFANPEKAVRDYVKNLMGRIVFLQFIQKKGWLGVPVGKEWGEGDKEFLQNLYDRCDQKDNFIDGILEVLFNDINTKRTNDVANTVLGSDIKVPYLNGGLFELSKADECSFRLPKKLMDAIITFFSSYNFTIDENDPDDAEIGIDPEMLGRIFENLLEDNKDKGAFYTPKEIVQYMCKESLIAYLQTDKYDSEKEAIRQFVTTYNANVLSSSLLADVDQKLKDVKICDPAIGSGAFPMGLLKELFACRSALEDLSGENAADIKKHIIQNNIYGVDIEKGAVDIARLRFWLSIIVDELTPHALPNMDFKIMQGNSLIPTFNGKYVNLNDKLRHVNSSKIRDAKKELFRLQSVFYDAEGDQKKELLVKIKYQILEIVKLQMDYEYKDEIERSAQTIDIFNQTTKQVKVDDEKARIIGMCIDLQRRLNASSISLSDKAEIDLPFFDWKIMFSDIFNNNLVKEGFDIVIGNPPYFVYQESHVGEIADIRRDKDYSVAFGGKLNAYKLFLANALKKLLSKDGICSFIFQNSFLGDRQATVLRKYVLENKMILNIDSFPERDSKKKRVFESVKMSVCIVLVKNTPADKDYTFNVDIWDDKDKSSGLNTCFSLRDIESIDNMDYTIPRLKPEYKNTIIKLISQKHIQLKCIEGELNVTFHKGYFTKNPSLPTILKGASIQRYYYTLQMSQGEIEYLEEQPYQRKYGSSDKSKHHLVPRIAMQGMTGANDKIRLVMAYIPAGYYLANSCNYILETDGINTKCLLGLLNSKVMNWFFRCFSTNSNVNGYEVDNFPVPAISQQIQDQIESLVDKIIEEKQISIYSDTTQLEKSIDCILYDVYGLNTDDINIIEG